MAHMPTQPSRSDQLLILNHAEFDPNEKIVYSPALPLLQIIHNPYPVKKSLTPYTIFVSCFQEYET